MPVTATKPAASPRTRMPWPPASNTTAPGWDKRPPRCWRDAWVTVEGRIRTDSVACRVESTDTLRQVVHRIPRRFLFIRWGTKALRQEIVSSNPHTRIVYSDYVKFER